MTASCDKSLADSVPSVNVDGHACQSSIPFHAWAVPSPGDKAGRASPDYGCSIVRLGSMSLTIHIFFN